jgi:hypothetical protein
VHIHVLHKSTQRRYGTNNGSNVRIIKAIKSDAPLRFSKHNNTRRRCHRREQKADKRRGCARLITFTYVCDALVLRALEGKVVKLNFSPESRTNALYLNLELAREAE